MGTNTKDQGQQKDQDQDKASMHTRSKPTKRFYIGASRIYGLTVYDRESQQPAFEFGADVNMPQMKAYQLSVRLNMRHERGTL